MQTLKIVSLIFAASMFAAACGDSKSSLNPTAPSAVSADASSAEAGAGEGEYSATAKPGNGNGNGNNGNGNGNNGNGNGNGNNGNGNGNQPPANTSPAPTSPVPSGKAKVEIEGLISAVGGGSITVGGQMVTVTPDTVIRHGNRRFEFSDLNVGDRVHVRAARVTSTGSGAAAAVSTLEAEEIKLQNPGDGEGEEAASALVSVAAFDASASETGTNPGSFRLTRAGTVTQLASALTVSFTLTGTALNGTDYLNVLPLSATFIAGQATVDVAVTPLFDTLLEGSETVILTLTTVPAPFELGSPVAATVDLSDGVNPLVSVTASDPSASESGDTGTFTLTRTGNVAAGLAVTLQFSGSATPGFDYETLATTVNFLAGQVMATVTVTPRSDAANDPSDTVIVTVVDGADYDLGAVSTATVTISGN